MTIAECDFYSFVLWEPRFLCFRKFAVSCSTGLKLYFSILQSEIQFLQIMQISQNHEIDKIFPD